MNILYSIRYFFHRMVHWEYWPQVLVYAPIFPVYLYYSAKAGTPFFNVAANPSMENGGYMMESKFTIHQQLPRHLVPKTIKISPGQVFETVKTCMVDQGVTFPCFCKPDIGGKGIGVSKIENELQLQQYHLQCTYAYLVQEEIPYKNEIGIFYCRLPYEQQGMITGIVGKKFLEVTGDGKRTLQQLIASVPRFYYQRKHLEAKYKEQLFQVLPAGQKFVLSEIGNHARGSEFVDLSDFNEPRLEKLIDELAKSYNTLYFGRYDIKFNSWEELYEGKNYMLIELNGSGSEPTHMYDIRKKLPQAYKIILKHWKLLYAICSYNHKMNTPYYTLKEGRKLQKQERLIKASFNFA